jgi:lipopolysaccharide export LptBFGC system permease protein LptF
VEYLGATEAMAVEQPRTVGSSSDNPSPSDAALRMQILSTEHWSLLATRSLTYSEAFSRVAMFISVLSGAMIAIALVAQADRFGTTFAVISILILVTVLLVGLVTIGRVMAVGHDDLLWVIGMNRIRNAYLELHPELEKYFVAGRYDDWPGIATTMRLNKVPQRGFKGLWHGLQTLPGMLGSIVSIVAAALVGLVARELGASPVACVLIAVVAFLITNVLLAIWGFKGISGFWKELAPKFPQPPR